MERVKKVHSVGGYGSQGYGYDWKIEEAQKNLLRTHTTAVSARMLYKLAQVKPFCRAEIKCIYQRCYFTNRKKNLNLPNTSASIEFSETKLLTPPT